MDVRGRRLRKQSDDALAFTSSNEADRRIAPHVVQVNMAHVAALMRAGMVAPESGSRLLEFLGSTSPDHGSGSPMEDCHQQLEQSAIDALGVNVAGSINLGKSRNDQVATAIRMELRATLLQLARDVVQLQDAFLKIADGSGALVFPGYTHLQRAQPVTLAHYAFAYFEALNRSVERILQTYDRVNLSPLGSGALGGTDVPIDRNFESDILGFKGVLANSMDGVSSRDFAVEAISCATIVMIDVGRLAEEQVLWSSTEFGFLSLPDEFAASSSMMPQKKNPVVAETARAKSGTVLGAFVSAVTILKALPYAYNLDLQELTPHLWTALDDTSDSVRLLARSLSEASFAPPGPGGPEDFSTATALANFLVAKHSFAFREAHAIVGGLVKASMDTKVPFEETVVAGIGSASAKFGKEVRLTRDETKAILDRVHFLSSIASVGGANPRAIPLQLRMMRRSLSESRERIDLEADSLRRSEARLLRLVGSLQKGVRGRK